MAKIRVNGKPQLCDISTSKIKENRARVDVELAIQFALVLSKLTKALYCVVGEAIHFSCTV